MLWMARGYSECRGDGRPEEEDACDSVIGLKLAVEGAAPAVEGLLLVERAPLAVEGLEEDEEGKLSSVGETLVA